MGKATELKTTEELVKEILTRFPDARNSDDVLYIKVCQRIDAISINLPFKDIILNRKAHGYPAYVSVARSGRKLRRMYPELSGNDTVEGHRKVNEEVFKEYSKTIV